MYSSSSAQFFRQQAQQQAFQDLLNRHNFMQSYNNAQNGIFPFASPELPYPNVIADMARSQLMLELQKLKVILDKERDDNLYKLLSKPARTGAIQAAPKAKPKLNLQPFNVSAFQFLNSVQLSTQNQTGSSVNYDKKPLSPASEASSGFGTSSEGSSGFGTGGSVSSSMFSTLSSPPLNDFDGFSNFGSPSPDSSVSNPLDTGDGPCIKYQGRNILDLQHNMTYQWNFQMAALTSSSTDTSIYQRLTPAGHCQAFKTTNCPDCDFFSVTAVAHSFK